jgi:hypothetical protein
MTWILVTRAAHENASSGTLMATALTSACGRTCRPTFGYTTLVTGVPGALGLLSVAVMFC